MMRPRIVQVVCWVAVAAGSVGLAAQATRPSAEALTTRLQILEDRDAIRALLVAYASTLDNRDFAVAVVRPGVHRRLLGDHA